MWSQITTFESPAASPAIYEPFENLGERGSRVGSGGVNMYIYIYVLILDRILEIPKKTGNTIGWLIFYLIVYSRMIINNKERTKHVGSGDALQFLLPSTCLSSQILPENAFSVAQVILPNKR